MLRIFLTLIGLMIFCIHQSNIYFNRNLHFHVHESLFFCAYTVSVDVLGFFLVGKGKSNEEIPLWWSDWNESFLLWLVMASSQEMWSSLTLDTRPLRPASGLIHLYLSRALVLYRSLLSCSHRSISSSKPPSYSRWCRLFAAWFFLCRFVLILLPSACITCKWRSSYWVGVGSLLKEWSSIYLFLLQIYNTTYSLLNQLTQLTDQRPNQIITNQTD